MTETEKAMLRVCMDTYCQMVSDRLYRKSNNFPLESAASSAIYQAIGVDVSKIEYDGKADTVLWSKLLELYNEKTGEQRLTLV
ncbi:hypothetical protein [Paenibacillus tyrfis]|uniref:hypothetical protein n=1 Tax=Paenibacillus tyrfis TaxID=1501230 RepID=UPI000B58D52D|nr:hypothetical protein [Paenibacillus tyrfis]